MESFGLKLISLEPKSTALLASFSASGVLDDGKYHACVAMGNEIANFIVMKGEAVLFGRPLAGIGEEPLVRLMVRNLSIKEGDARQALAEWIKRGGAGGMGDVKGEGTHDSGLGGVGMTMKQFFSQMVIELQRSIDAFCIMYSMDRVDTIHVCGKGVFYPGLVSHLHKTLGVNTIVYNPFAKLLETGVHVEEISRRAPLFSVAVGLAIP
jgi:Tfp pilus assembly PilM family ATPase